MLSDVRPVVLFDLFGTLVPGGTREQRDAVAHAVAGELDVPRDTFAQLVRDTFDDRTTGRLGDLESSIRELAARLGAKPSAEALGHAVQLRLALNRSLLGASWAPPVLDRLKASDVLIGVVSDCSAETLAVWAESPLDARIDVTAFSCLLGVRKPAPAIYLAATDALRVCEPSGSTTPAPNRSNDEVKKLAGTANGSPSSTSFTICSMSSPMLEVTEHRPDAIPVAGRLLAPQQA